MLKIENLHAGYGEFEVLHGVDIDVAPDEIVALIGPNGAGKSTVLKSVFNLCDVRAGKITFKDRDITRLPTHDLIAEGISFVSQGRTLFSHMTVHENLEMGGYALRDNEVVQANLADAYKKFPVLKQKQHEYAFALSGGQQQLLSIAGALVQNPRLLLLDEPSLGLSPKATKEVFDEIQKINAEGIGILIAEQNAAKAVSIAHRTVVLEDGEIAFSGGKEILRDARIKNVYLGGP
ncbi:MAG: ABC transporter ATP-binding protein [Candidatus Diapherotrites archaeon]|nr:ABC transporter ATP-binding protein [Candidatus Diapherotrites archaeon]